jgi:hypothetical protein
LKTPRLWTGARADQTAPDGEFCLCLPLILAGFRLPGGSRSSLAPVVPSPGRGVSLGGDTPLSLTQDAQLSLAELSRIPLVHFSG